MSTKISVDRAITKANSHAKKGEISEAQKQYQAVLLAFPQNIRAQQGLDSLNKSIPNKEIIDQLVSLYNQGQHLAVVEQAKALTLKYPQAFIIWNILGVAYISLEHFELLCSQISKVQTNYVEDFAFALT